MLLKKFKNSFYSGVCFFSFLICFLSAPALPLNAQVISPGEELLYEVSFLGIKLGSIKITTEPNELLNQKVVNKAKAIMDSYSGIPFVDLHVIYQSWMDPSLSFSHQFIGNTKEKEYWLYDKLDFDYDSKNIHIEKWKLKDKYYSNDIPTNKKISDGLSLFFVARQHLRSNKTLKIPTFIDKAVVSTTINFTGRKENVDIKAVNYPVKTIYFFGLTDWTGIYGLTGRFEGWFTDDAASVPIKANMKVYVGSVRIELISWKRASWTPPKG